MQTYAFLSSPETLFSLTANFLDDRHIWTFGDVVSSRSVCGGRDWGAWVPTESPMPRGGGLPSSHRSFSFYGIQGNVGAPPGGPELHRHLGAPTGRSGDSRGQEAVISPRPWASSPTLVPACFPDAPLLGVPQG